MNAHAHLRTAILLMGADDKDRKRISSLLNKVGLDAVNADSASEALKRALRQSTRLVVVDPAIGGLDLRGFLEELHRIDENIGVVCLGDSDGKVSEMRTQAVGQIQRCLKRPFRRAQLLASILGATEAPLKRRE